jgi:pimeloyl-ACP methyl ester carboxylesterase
MYDTGNPIPYSGALLRQALVDAVHRLDPDGTDPALQQMVVVGHSQGGLLTKLTAVDTGDNLWRNISDKPFDENDFAPEDRDLVKRVAFMTPLPFVKRVVFIATPHRGSYLTLFSVAQWIRGFIRLPGNLLRVGASFAAQRPNWRIPTSLDNMTPGNPFIKALSQIPLAPGVTGHSIIAVQGDGPPEEGNDGVVEYTSAHIDGVESELVVRSSHSCQSNPNVVAEVRRILIENAKAAEAAGG